MYNTVLLRSFKSQILLNNSLYKNPKYIKNKKYLHF